MHAFSPIFEHIITTSIIITSYIEDVDDDLVTLNPQNTYTASYSTQMNCP